MPASSLRKSAPLCSWITTAAAPGTSRTRPTGPLAVRRMKCTSTPSTTSSARHAEGLRQWPGASACWGTTRTGPSSSTPSRMTARCGTRAMASAAADALSLFLSQRRSSRHTRAAVCVTVQRTLDSDHRAAATPRSGAATAHLVSASARLSVPHAPPALAVTNASA